MEKSQSIRRAIVTDPFKLINIVAEGGVYSLKDYSNYRALPQIANSDISLFKKSIKQFHKEKILGEKEPEEELESYKKFGTIFDNFILNPDLFKQKYILIPEGVESPSNAYHQGYVADRIRGEIEEIAYANHYSTENKSQKKIKSKIKDLEEDYGDYINFKIKAKDKVEYSQNQSKQLSDMKIAVMNHLGANYLLLGDEIYPDPVQAFSHLKLAAKEGNRYQIKGELDRLVIDFESKILYVTDVKTTSNRASFFETDLCKYRYYRQLSNYTLLSLGWLVSEFDVSIEDLKNWHIVPALVAVESVGNPECRVVALSSDALKDGFIEIVENYKTIQWHKQQDRWEHRKAYYNSNRGIELFEDYRPRNFDPDEFNLSEE